MSAAEGLPAYSTEIAEEWIDYNGHLSEAFYVLIFGCATDQAMEVLGMGPEYRERAGASLYTVEAHVRYLQEVPRGASVQVRTVIAGSAEKKLHLAHEMYRVESQAAEEGSGELVATEEILGVHVGGDPAGAQPFPAEVAELIAQHSGQDAPAWTGRAIRPVA